MALVNMDRWLAEHGASPRSEFATVEQGPPPVDPGMISHIQDLEAEISRQADLIVRLQAALGARVQQENQAVMSKMAGPKKSVVIRKPRERKV